MKLLKLVYGWAKFAEIQGDPICFHVFRSSLALALVLNWLHLLPGLRESLTTEGFHFSLAAAESAGRYVLPPLQEPWLGIFVVFTFVNLILLAIGKAPRSMAAFAIVPLLVFILVDPPSSSAQLKIAILSLGLISIVSPKDLNKPWPVFLGRFLLVSIYFLAGWRKTVFGSWLDNLQGLEGIMRGNFQTPLARMAVDQLPSWLWSASQVSVILFQLLSPFLFFKRSTRTGALVFGLLFHLGIGLMMDDLIFFSVVVLCFYPLFLSPQSLRRFGHAFKRLSRFEKP